MKENDQKFKKYANGLIARKSKESREYYLLF